MRLGLTIITLTTCLATHAASAADFRIKNTHSFGCTSEDLYDKLGEYVAQNDQQAFTRVLNAGIATRVCTIFKEGEPVLIAETGLFKTKIRRRGNVAEYWTSTDSLSK